MAGAVQAMGTQGYPLENHYNNGTASDTFAFQDLSYLMTFQTTLGPMIAGWALNVTLDALPAIASSIEGYITQFFRFPSGAAAEKLADSCTSDTDLSLNIDEESRAQWNYEKGLALVHDCRQAIPHFEIALKLRLEIFGESSIPTADTHFELGQCLLYGMQLHHDSLIHHQQALETRLALLGESHPAIAESYSSLGDNYIRLGKLESVRYGHAENLRKALNYYQKALDLRLNRLGSHHRDTAMSYSNVGYAMDFLEKPKEAFEHYKKALDISLTTLGNTHADTAYHYSRIGDLLQRHQNYAGALNYYEKQLEINLNLLGPDNVKVANTHFHIGESFEQLEMYEEALGHYKNALDIQRKQLNDDALATDKSQNGVARCSDILYSNKLKN